MGMLDCLQCQTLALQTGLTMHDRYHDVSTEIFASVCVIDASLKWIDA